ncbi:hypothetical protein CEXT_213601 [Caerostris extrusa]|uniref:Uncharacterized protein n=1 Tax=Caerostris extrusa TaxID=172846 RepID=A0AAV4MCL2_CAEEX|nr:hypothetical protein CEXT_213601 [Caerostris extrusa]
MDGHGNISAIQTLLLLVVLKFSHCGPDTLRSVAVGQLHQIQISGKFNRQYKKSIPKMHLLENQIFSYWERYKKPPFRTIIRFLIPPPSPKKTPSKQTLPLSSLERLPRDGNRKAQISERYIYMSLHINKKPPFRTIIRFLIPLPLPQKQPLPNRHYGCRRWKGFPERQQSEAQISEPYLPYICMGPVNHTAQSPTRRRSRIYKPKIAGESNIQLLGKGSILDKQETTLSNNNSVSHPLPPPSKTAPSKQTLRLSSVERLPRETAIGSSNIRAISTIHLQGPRESRSAVPN